MHDSVERSLSGYDFWNDIREALKSCVLQLGWFTEHCSDVVATYLNLVCYYDIRAVC